MSKKKRGGQRGNKNALKHGIYAKYFTAAESKLLDHLKKSPDDLESEIAMARVAMLRVFEVFSKEDGLGRLEMFAALSVASTRLATLLRTAKFLRGEGDDVGLALAQALAELTNGK